MAEATENAAEVGAPGWSPSRSARFCEDCCSPAAMTACLRHAVAGGGGEGEVAAHTLWWPPSKIAGRYLAAYLFGRDDGQIVEAIRAGHVPVEIALSPRATAGHS